MSEISSTTGSSTPSNSDIFTVSSFYESYQTIFPCLHTRMLHEQCGHISTLTIHEVPCRRPYYGWVLAPLRSPTSPLHPPRIHCEDMEFHVAISKDKCKNCQRPAQAPVSKSMFESFGLSRGTKNEVPVVKRERDRRLDVGEIVKRRLEWKKEVDARKARRLERIQELVRVRF